MSEYMLDILLNTLDVFTVFDQRDDDWIKIENPNILAVSKQKEPTQGAALIRIGKKEAWIPKSQMKCDFDRNIYIRRWIWEKNF